MLLSGAWAPALHARLAGYRVATMRLYREKNESRVGAGAHPGRDGSEFERKVATNFAAHATAIHCRTDVMFAILMQLQWIGAIIAAGFLTPFLGADPDVARVNMLVAVFGGGGLAAMSTSLAVLR